MNYTFGNSFFRNSMDLFDRNNIKETEYLRTDIYEKDGAYYLKIEIPGVEKKDIEVGFENGYLTINVTQEHYEEEYIRKERITEEMRRSYYLGEIDEDTIKANYENGILTIRLEKQKEKVETKKQIIIE